MNLRKSLYKMLLFFKKSKRIEYYNKILSYQTLSIGDLKKLQNEKLEKLLLHSYKNVPYYRKVLKEAGVIVQDKVNLENFERIPILTKDILRKEYDNLKSNDLENRKWYTNHSGGSTGEPTEFIQDKEYFDWGMANKMLWDNMAGHTVGEPYFRLWGSERDLMGQNMKFKQKIEKYLLNMHELNAFRMTKEDMCEYAKLINSEPPGLIEGYVNPLYEFANFLNEGGIKIKSPKGIISSAGTLYPEMKKIIENVFGCPVWNRYGTREVGDIACGKNQLKIAVWSYYVEIVDNGNNPTNKMGRILVTNLNNYSMPLIRYDIGDIGQLSRKWGFFEKVEGREVSVLKTKDGRIVSGLLFVHFLGVVMNNGFILRFQLIQENYDTIRIKVVVLNRKKFESKKRKISELIEIAMGYKCQIIWEEVNDIKPLKSGKYLYVKSEVS